jgi:hypothetical protein
MQEFNSNNFEESDEEIIEEYSEELDPNVIKIENCFELPDESTIEFHESSLNLWGGMLINNEAIQNCFDYYVPSLLQNVECFKNHQELFLVNKLSVKNLHEYLFDCFDFCDKDFATKISSKILLTGGASQTTGLYDQFKYVR